MRKTSKEHYKEEQHDKRLYDRTNRLTKKTNYKLNGKTVSSSAREDLIYSQAGNKGVRKSQIKDLLAKKMGKKK